MAITGKVRTLFTDKTQSEALFPKTKVSAISDENGVGLDSILSEMIYTGDVIEDATGIVNADTLGGRPASDFPTANEVIYTGENEDTDLVPLNADTLGGIPADEYATENFVAVKIAEAQMGGGSGDIDLSGYATKDDVSNAVRAIDFPVDSVNGKTGAVQLSAEDISAATANHNHDITTLDGYVERMIDILVPRTANTVLAAPNGSNGGSSFRKLVAADLPTVPVNKGGTGATTAANARTKLGITPANIGAVAKTELKSLAYNATDENGNITVNLISQYPTTPGIYRVGSPVNGLPINIIGYGILVIFNAGEYYLHLYKDAGGGLFHARTDNTVTPVQKNWRGIGGGVAWSNASPGSGFGKQTWQSDLSAWTYVAIKFAFHTSLYTDDQYTWWECCPIGFGGTANFTSLGGDSYPVTVRRKYSVSKNGVSFGNGGYQQGTTHNLNDNTRAIPMEIYVW